MTERPILFSAPMVRAILEGRKSQTRRVVKPQPVDCTQAVAHFRGREWHAKMADPEIAGLTLHLGEHPCPYGQRGDRLRVKEHAWMFCERRPNGVTKTGRQKWHYVPLRAAPVLHCESHPDRPTIGVVHPETGNEWGWRKKLGRFLPAWASRITLDVTAVRVERLQDISQVDAKAEGARLQDWSGEDPLAQYSEWGGDAPPKSSTPGFYTYRNGYRRVWEHINGVGSWAANPWVWVLEFRRV
jgi:hypothetical protein